MKKLLFLIPVVLGLGLGKAEESSKTIDIIYNSPEMDLAWNGGDLKITKRKYEYDNPVSGTPSGVNATESIQPLSDIDRNALQLKLESIFHEFFALPNEVGAPEGERFYGYTIYLSKGSQFKRVLFRSNPSFPGAPETFKNLEKIILDLIKK